MRSATLASAITEEDHAQGPADAAITLVQYGDYECPYTRLSRHSVHQLQRELSDSLRFVFRHFPLEEIHPHARALEDADLKRYAVELGLDSDRFARDRTSPEVANRIDRDLASGERSGVPGSALRRCRRTGGHTRFGPRRGGQGLNGPVELWIETLTEWATDLGLDTFVFWPEDAAEQQVRLFAEEVVPGVLENVNALRTTTAGTF